MTPRGELCRQEMEPGTFENRTCPVLKLPRCEMFYRLGENAGLIVNVRLRPGSSVRRSAAPGE